MILYTVYTVVTVQQLTLNLSVEPILSLSTIPDNFDNLSLPNAAEFADLTEPVYKTLIKTDLESSNLLKQVDIGDRSFFDIPNR